MAGTTQKAPPAAKKGTPVARRPFTAGTRAIDRTYYDQSRTFSASSQKYDPWDIGSSGFFSGAYLLMECVTAGNSAAVAFTANGPWSAIDIVQLNDVQSQPMLGPMTGWDLYIVNKYGGYGFQNDPRMWGQYFALTGAGATGGSFSFSLRIPVEIVKRDALGTLPNKNNAASFKVEVTLAPTASVYSVAPTAAGAVRLRFQLFGYDDPSDVDLKGNAVSQNPPAVNTTQYWQKQTYPVNAGSLNLRLQGIDALVRGLVFVLTDGSSSRSVGDTSFPDPFTIKYEGKEILNRFKTIWQQQISEQYGYGRAPGGALTAVVAPEAAGARDLGVYPWMFHTDFTTAPGAETRLTYLPVSSATSIELTGTLGNAGTLTVLVNKIVPANGNPMALTGR
ncbi:MAG: hypothetical protein A2Y78_10120 [Acidobacteria bacterium RBG_13_68_16]|nr:MAG: hypothetical protein A2Y78_10120 [Acidobacteria bacterium RBG_13_68_16]